MRTWWRLSLATVIVAAGCGAPLAPAGTSGRDPEALTRALASVRILEGRLPGTSGYSAWSPDHARQRPPVDALAIAADILKRAPRNATPDGAYAVALAEAQLVAGDLEAAIVGLERACANADATATDALILLSAAYLERSRLHEDAKAAAQAIDAAERAVRLGPDRLEGRFNRALALERLQLHEQAAAAWRDYVGRDSHSGWADEATQALARAGNDEADWTRFRLAIIADKPPTGLPPSESDVRQMARRFADRCRELVEDELLMQWAHAAMSGDVPARDRSLATASRIAAALRDERGDRMLDDFIRHLTNGSANAVLAGIRARAAIDRGDVEQAREDLAVARRSLAAATTPASAADELDLYALLAQYYRADYAAALAGLRTLQTRAMTRHHLYVAGRCAFTLAAIAVRQAKATDAERLYREAARLFAQAGETGYLASLHAIQSSNRRDEGDDRHAWAELRAAFSLMSDGTNVRHRYAILRAAQAAAVDGHLSGLAARVASDLVATAERWRNPIVLVGALADDTRQAALVGDTVQADRSLQRARLALPRIPDPHVRELSSAAVARAEAAALLTAHPCDAIAPGTAAIDTLTRVAPYQLATAFLERSRAQHACGRLAEAEADLRRGIQVFESQRRFQQDEQRRVSRFDEAWQLYADLTRLLAVDRGDPDAALQVAEQARARALAEDVGQEDRPFDRVALAALQAQLESREAVLTYVVMPRDLLLWTITRRAVTFSRLAVTSDEIERLVTEWRRLVLDGADERAVGQRLFDVLLRPVAASLPPDGLVTVVSDGPLHALPLGALWDGRQYVIERCGVWTIPSLRLVGWAADRLRTARSAAASSQLVAIGDPAYAIERFPNLPRLPEAAREARDIARLYPHATTLIGGEAVKRAVLAAFARADVVHIAAHAVANVASPADSYIVTAADRVSQDDRLLPADVIHLARLRTRVIVLSGCETAAGRIARGEGVLSLGRTFMAAGIPIVIANLWPVSDRESYDLLVTLHRELIQGRPAADALRATQLRQLHGLRPSTGHVRAWAGLIGLGATGPIAGIPPRTNQASATH